MTTTTQTTTADELLRMSGDQRHELVKGELRTMAPAGFEHGHVIMKLAKQLANHVDDRKLGVVLGAETGFQLAKNPDTVRGADIAFVAAARIPVGSKTIGYWNGGPDLAVEVVSPYDTVQEVEDKVGDYLSAGSRMVWIVNPKRRTVTVHVANGNPVTHKSGGTLDAGDVVPGFRCNVNDIFE